MAKSKRKTPNQTKKPVIVARQTPAKGPSSAKTDPPTQEGEFVNEEAHEKESEPALPEMKFEPGPDDEIKPGEVDAMGNYFLEELDFLRLQSRKERRDACKAQAEALRLKAEVMHMKFQVEHAKFMNQAASFERAAVVHENSVQDTLTELSKKYDIDFKDKTVSIDEDLGKIVATDPTKGLPRLSEALVVSKAGG